MSLIDTIKEMGSIAIITMVFGVFLSLLIKNLPNHFGNQNYDMYFNLLIILAGLQLFVIIYIGARPYINLYKDPSGTIPVQDDKDFFYYWWDWMYPGYGTKGIELDVFMYIAYLIVIILVILVVLNKVNNRGNFDSQDFKNPLSFGICLLEDNGYNIFLFGNIFMFLYISRFMIKGLNLLGSKTVACPGNNVKSCFSQEEIELFATIKECNDNMTEVECKKEEYPIFKLDGCSTVENEYLKSVYDYKSPLKVIKDPDTNKFRLKNENNNKSYKELGSKCKNSINDLLLKMDASNFPPEKCGDSIYGKATNIGEGGCDMVQGSSFEGLNEDYYCQGNPCRSDECCRPFVHGQCIDEFRGHDACRIAGSPGPRFKDDADRCAGEKCTAKECCITDYTCDNTLFSAETCSAPGDEYKGEGICASDPCTNAECCKGSDNDENEDGNGNGSLGNNSDNP